MDSKMGAAEGEGKGMGIGVSEVTCVMLSVGLNILNVRHRGKIIVKNDALKHERKLRPNIDEKITPRHRGKTTPQKRHRQQNMPARKRPNPKILRKMEDFQADKIDKQIPTSDELGKRREPTKSDQRTNGATNTAPKPKSHPIFQQTTRQKERKPTKVKKS